MLDTNKNIEFLSFFIFTYFYSSIYAVYLMWEQ